MKSSRWTRFVGFDIRTNFNIYGLDTASGEYQLLRAGYLDQMGSS